MRYAVRVRGFRSLFAAFVCIAGLVGALPAACSAAAGEVTGGVAGRFVDAVRFLEHQQSSGDKIDLVGDEIRRLRADGAADPSFGAGGVARLDSDDYELLVLRDDRLLVFAGSRLTRLSRDGVVDPTFGAGGSLQLDGTIREVLELADGRVAVSVRSTSREDAKLVALTTSGSIDTSFGTGGTLTMFGAASADVLAPDPNGLVVGASQRQGSGGLLLAVSSAGVVRWRADTLEGAPRKIRRATSGDLLIAGTADLSVPFKSTASAGFAARFSGAGQRLGGLRLDFDYDPVFGGGRDEISTEGVDIAELANGKLLFLGREREPLIPWAPSPTWFTARLSPSMRLDKGYAGQDAPQPGVVYLPQVNAGGGQIQEATIDPRASGAVEMRAQVCRTTRCRIPVACARIGCVGALGATIDASGRAISSRLAPAVSWVRPNRGIALQRSLAYRWAVSSSRRPLVRVSVDAGRFPFTRITRGGTSWIGRGPRTGIGTLRLGHGEHCVRVQAWDTKLQHRSSPLLCVFRPYGIDRFTSRSGWQTVRRGGFDGASIEATTNSATFRVVAPSSATELTLVARTCRGCGTIAVRRGAGRWTYRKLDGATHMNRIVSAPVRPGVGQITVAVVDRGNGVTINGALVR